MDLLPSTCSSSQPIDQHGKHLETINTVTGLTEYVFGYGKDSGLHESITDKNGNQMLIQRDSSNLPIAIKAPYGQLTKLVAMANPSAIGDLASITDPLGRTTMTTWDHLGQLGSVTDPKAWGYVFGYDPVGRLTSVTDPTGYSETLARTETPNGWSVAVTNAANESINYSVQYPSESWKRMVTRPDKS